MYVSVLVVLCSVACGLAQEIDCEVWFEPWTSCSVTCGTGTQTRQGFLEVAPSPGGLPCPPLNQERECNAQDCDATTDSPPPVDCHELDNGPQPDPVSECSSVFWTCANGVATRQECPEGLYYDPQIQACDIFAHVYVCSQRTRPISTTTPQNEPATTTPDPVMDCRTVPDGRYPNPLVACSESFYACQNGVTRRLSCPSDLRYDVERDLCDRYAAVFACSGKRPYLTTPQPEPETSSTSIPIDCNSLANGNHPDPEMLCSQKYYMCDNGVGSVQTCPGSTFYDAELMVCNDFDNIPDCTGQPRPTTNQPETTTPHPTPRPEPFDCSLLEDGLYPASDCESFFWMCVGGTTRREHCPNRLAFDAEYQECAHPSTIPTCGGIRTTTQPPQETTTPTQLLPSSSLDCRFLLDGNYPDPKDPCGPNYFTCASGRSVVFQCPGKLAYNPASNTCGLSKYVSACKHKGGKQADPANTVHLRKPSIDQPQPPAVGQPQPPHVGQPQPPSVGQPQPPHVGQPQPPSVGQPQPPHVGQPQPPSVGQPQPPHVGQPQPPSLGQPQPPHVGQPQPPSVGQPQPPHVGQPQPPSVGQPQPPHVGQPQPPSVGQPQPPHVGQPQPPSVGQPQPPHVGQPQPPSVGQPQPPHVGQPQPPSVGQPQPPHVGQPQPPSLGQPQPPHVGQPQPPSVGQLQPPHAGQPQPPSVGQPQPPHVGQPQPPSVGQPQPPHVDQPQPPSVGQPPNVGQPQPPSVGQPQPPHVGQPQPPSVGQPQPPHVGQPQPPSVGQPQPPHVGQPQPPSVGQPQPPHVGQPQPPRGGIDKQPFAMENFLTPEFFRQLLESGFLQQLGGQFLPPMAPHQPAPAPIHPDQI